MSLHLGDQRSLWVLLVAEQAIARARAAGFRRLATVRGPVAQVVRAHA